MTFPSVYTGVVRLAGAAIPAALDVGSGFVYSALAAAGGGMAPRAFNPYAKPTERSVVAIDTGSAVTLSSLSSFFPTSHGTVPGPLHCGVFSLSVPPGNVPGFLFLAIGPVVTFAALHGTTLALSTGDAWQNELGVGPADVRLVDVPKDAPEAGGGPTLVMRGPGDELGDAIYLRPFTPSDTAAPAILVAVDLRPSPSFDVDLSRFHAIAHDDQTITVYYRIYDGAGFDGTAVVSVSGIDGSVRVRPTVCLGGYVPVVSTGGALRHPVTNEILAAFEPAGMTPYKQICWHASRGLGIVFDPVPLVWNAVTHPYIFGGRWARAAPDQKIHVVGLGWADRNAGSSFRAYLGHETGLILPGFRDLENTYQSRKDNYASAKRILAGEIACVRADGENGAASTFQWLSTNFSKLHQRAELRNGFPRSLDVLDPVLYCRFDDVHGTDVVSEIGPSGQLTNTVPALGYIGMSRLLESNEDSIVFPDDGSLSTEYLTFVGFVFPSSISASDIVRKGEAWEVTWTGSRFRAGVRNAGNTKYTAQHALPCAIERWYHLAVTYDGRYLRLYVWGVLAAETDTGSTSTLLPSTDPISIATTTSAAFGRVEDFVVAGEAISHKDLLSVIAYTVMTRSGEPLAGARRPGRPDSVLCVATLTKEDGAVLTVAARGTRLMMQTGFYTNSLFFDVWERRRGEDPVFLATFPAAPEINAVVGGYGHGALPLNGHPMRLFRTDHGYALFVATKTVNNGLHLHRYLFTEDFDPIDFSMDRVAYSSGEWRWDAIEIVQDAFDKNVFLTILALSDPVAGSGVVYVIRPSVWGTDAISSSHFRNVADMLPPESESLPWSSATISTNGAGRLYVSGIVGRITTPDMGLSSGLHNKIQIIYSIRTPGGTQADQTDIATLTAIINWIDPDSTDPPVQFGFSVDPIQLDEHGRGGTPPMRPISWIPNPLGPTGETFLLGVSGSRGVEPSVFRGDGGQTLYQLRREGTWGLHIIFPIPLQPFVTSWDLEALGDISFSVDENYRYRYVLTVARPHHDASDKCSSTVISMLEAVAGVYGLNSALPPLDNPIARVATAQNLVCWTDHVIDTRTFSHEITGPKFSVGKHNRAAVVLRWSTPGAPGGAYEDDFADHRIPALQGGAYSQANRLTRFFSLAGNDELVPMLGGKQLRLEGSGHLSRTAMPTLGTIRGTDRVIPVGIVDQGNVGRYVFFRVVGDALARLEAYDSPHDAELDPEIDAVTLWEPPSALDEDVWQRARVVVCGGVLYLYAVLGASRNHVHFLRLPSPGEPATAEPMRPITTIGGFVADRMYAVETEQTHVALYFGDADGTASFRTMAFVHDPNVWAYGYTTHPVGKIVVPERTIAGVSPFPCSYAAARGPTRGGLAQTFVVMEPMRSRHDGGRRALQTDPLAAEFSGNAWEIVTFASDGIVEIERIAIDQRHVTAFMGGSHAGAAGGRSSVRTRPALLAHVPDGEAESGEFVLLAAVKDTSIHLDIPPASSFRYDAAASLQRNVGAHVGISNLDAAGLAPTSIEDKARMAHLVPGSVLIDPVGGVSAAKGDLYSGAETLANPLGAWDLADNQSMITGANVSHDQIHGVKCLAYAPNRLFIVGWFIVGE